MIREAISRLVDGQSLSRDEAAAVMAEIMAGEATDAQIGAFATALRMKGETVDEIAGLAGTMREHAAKVSVHQHLVDTCGTGGDGSGTFNISTAAAIVAAGAGIAIAKHGNRAMSSRCGSADVLEALGVNISLGPDSVARCINQAGIGFMFAPVFHPAMKHVAAPRKELGIRTVFNILGPLTNPAGAEAQVLGVASPVLVEKMAMVLAALGCRYALVVHGEDGVDELSLAGPTLVAEVRDGTVTRYTVRPEDAGLKASPGASLLGGSASVNAALILAVLEGADGPGRRVVILNAAAALVAGGAAADLREGVQIGARAIDSGAARQALSRLVAVSNEQEVRAA